MSSFSMASSMLAATKAFCSRTLSLLSAFFLMGTISWLKFERKGGIQSFELEPPDSDEHLADFGESLLVFVDHEVGPILKIFIDLLEGLEG